VTRQIVLTIVGDGGTDRVLGPVIQWAIHRIDPVVDILEPEFRKRKGGVREFLEHYETGSMLLFVHRDSETLSRAERLEEFRDVERDDVVPVIPVRMSEAWLLIDGPAIATAAGRPAAAVTVPPLNQLESLADPKHELEKLLFAAAGNPSGRRLKQFRTSLTSRRVNVASLIDDFSPLESVPSFQKFQEDLAARYPFSPGTP
jgi:hypothetical protein